MSVSEAGKVSANFSYHLDGQIAGVTYADGRRENYLWDGLALIHRDGTVLLNEPAITGGNPVLSGDKVLFNDMLGNTLGVKDQSSYQPIKMTAFGESDNENAFFTGKPLVGELGYAFLFRNYRPEQGKWQTADPLGYPDGWNNFSYCNNFPTAMIDLLGLEKTKEQQLTENLFKCATSDLPWAKNAQALLNAAVMNNPNPLKDYLNTTASTIGDLVDVLPDGTPGKSALEKVRDVAEAGGSIVSAVENFINNDPSFISDIISLSGAENIPGVGDYMGFINDSVSAISEALGDLKDSLAYGYGQYITDPTTGDFYLNSLIERELIVPKSLYEKALSRILE